MMRLAAPSENQNRALAVARATNRVLYSKRLFACGRFAVSSTWPAEDAKTQPPRKADVAFLAPPARIELTTNP